MPRGGGRSGVLQDQSLDEAEFGRGARDVPVPHTPIGLGPELLGFLATSTSRGGLDGDREKVRRRTQVPSPRNVAIGSGVAQAACGSSWDSVAVVTAVMPASASHALLPCSAAA